MASYDEAGYFCVSQQAHRADNALDIVAKSSGSCSNAVNTAVFYRLRVLVNSPDGSPKPIRLVLYAYPQEGEYGDNCDYIAVKLVIPENGKVAGWLRYVHSRGGGTVGPYIYAAWPAWTTGDIQMGNTVDDTNCPDWSGRHVHQVISKVNGSSQGPADCSSYNSALAVGPIYVVWDSSKWVHKIRFTEGQGNCW